MLAMIAAAMPAIDPAFATNITVYHVNEHKFGAIPVNMDTGDATGDMFFDMLEVIIAPLKCQNASKPSHGPDPCINPEATGADLMVNKLTLEVDSRYSAYAACNVGVNGTDAFGHKCKTDTYCCFCSFMSSKPECKATPGYENVHDKFQRFIKPGCKPTLFHPHPSKADCYTGNVFSKLTPTQHGSWYSTLEQGYCGASSQRDASSSDCTWRVASVDKIVKRACHTRIFGAVVATKAPECFESCGSQKTNTSSPCWVDCFYKAALGPEAGKPGGAVSGMSLTELVAAWEKPFLPEDAGGCPAQMEMPPWFAREEASR